MTKPYHHGDLRSALLASAEAVLDRDGIAALTLRAVAREAGVSHAAPAHHFGDLTGLLTGLATLGFVRFRASLLEEVARAGPSAEARLIALGRGYVGFARRYPGVFQLMFRSERLDWSQPALAEAGSAAFGLLTQDLPLEAAGRAGQDMVTAVARWSLVHGLATLLLDGRLKATITHQPATSADALIDAVLTAAFAAQTGAGRPPAG